MDRRIFVKAIGGAFACTSVAFGQSLGKMYRIGRLSGSSFVTTPLSEAFIASMREHGLIEGRHFTIENLLSEGHS